MQITQRTYKQPVGTIQDYLGTTAPPGWLLLNGSTIGNGSSGATGRAGSDTLPLYKLLWESLANTEAPVSGGRGANASADFSANKTLTMPDARQRMAIAKAASGTGSTLGGTGGQLDHSHTVPPHFHRMGAGADLHIEAHSSSRHQHGILATPPHSFMRIALVQGGATHSVYLPMGAGGPESKCYADTIIDGYDSAHAHDAASVKGVIGLVDGGVEGNSEMTSGANNPPFLTVNRIIYFGQV